MNDELIKWSDIAYYLEALKIADKINKSISKNVAHKTKQKLIRTFYLKSRVSALLIMSRVNCRDPIYNG